MSANRNRVRDELLKSNNIPQSILSISYPMMITGLSDALYNIVDSIFVGKFIGEKALAALAINNTIFIGLFAVGGLFSTGMSSIISRALGARNHRKVSLTVINGIVMSVISVFLLSLVLLFEFDNVLKFIGASEDILLYTREYGQIILIFGFLIPIKAVLDSLLRTKGLVKYIMGLSILGGFMNISLDALFIWVFDFGIQGIAWATVISQLTVVVILCFLVSRTYKISFHIYYLKFMSLRLIAEIAKLGVSQFLRVATFTFFGIAANRVLSGYGVVAVAAFGIVNRILHLAYQPIFGSNLGVQALIGYNYGAKNYAKVNTIISMSIGLATILGGFFTVLFVWAPSFLFDSFTQDIAIIQMAQTSIRTTGITFFLYGLQIFSTGALLAMGHPKMALFLSVFRPMVMVVCILVLPQLFNISGVWYTFPVTDIISSTITFILIRRELSILYNKEQLLKDTRSL